MKSFAAVIVMVLATAGIVSAQEASTDNTTVLAKTAARSSGGNSWIERTITIRAGDVLSAVLRDLGATPEEVKAIAAVLGGGDLKEGQQLRVLLSPVNGLERLQPIRIMLVDERVTEAMVALSDLGRYVNVGMFGLSSDIALGPDGKTGAVKSDRLESAELTQPERPGDATAVLEQSRETAAASQPTAPTRSVPTVPISHPSGVATLAPWPIRNALPSETYAPLNQALQAVKSAVGDSGVRITPKLPLPRLERPTWAWPPGKFWWAVAPGLPSASRTWRAGWQPVLPEMIRIASTVELPVALQAKLPLWVRDTSMAMVTTDSLAPWPRRRAPDFRLPRGPSHFEGEKYLEPPSRFVRWHDRIEVVLSMDEVDRHCRASLGKSPPAGRHYRGCTRGVAGRCLITRIDDPGVARHELAHCNGWKHPE